MNNCVIHVSAHYHFLKNKKKKKRRKKKYLEVRLNSRANTAERCPNAPGTREGATFQSVASALWTNTSTTGRVINSPILERHRYTILSSQCSINNHKLTFWFLRSVKTIFSVCLTSLHQTSVMYTKLLIPTFYLVLFIKDFPCKTCRVAAYSHTFRRHSKGQGGPYVHERKRTVFLQIMVVPNVIKIRLQNIAMKSGLSMLVLGSTVTIVSLRKLFYKASIQYLLLIG